MVPEGMPEAERADGAVEAATDGGGDGRCTLIALGDAQEAGEAEMVKLGGRSRSASR